VDQPNDLTDTEPADPETETVPVEDDETPYADRLAAALAALDDDALRQAVGAMSEQSRTELAGTLQMPRATMHLGNALPPLLRRKLHAAPLQRQLTAAFALCEAVNDETVHALGERHDDPTRDDMLEVLPTIVEHHGTALVTLMLAAYAASDAQCQAVMADLLDTDERFVIGEAIADSSTDGITVTHTAPTTQDDKEREARRDERKAAKTARREAQKHERAAQQAAHAARREAQRRAKRS
jgi:hypothetical protein